MSEVLFLFLFLFPTVFFISKGGFYLLKNQSKLKEGATSLIN